MILRTPALTYSVVIPAFNAEQTIDRAIDSVLAQPSQPLEVIIVDDGSRQPLNRFLSDVPPIVHVERQANQGAAAARNRGIELARGDLIAFLDADDYWLSDKMTRQLHAFEAYPEMSISGGAFIEQEPSGEQRLRRCSAIDDWSRHPFQLHGPDLFSAACALWTGTVVVRSSHLGAQRFLSGWEPAEDRELWLRLVRDGAVMFHREPLAVAVLEPDSLSRSLIDRDCRNMLRVIDAGKKELGWLHYRKWRLRTYRRWAAEYLGCKSRSAWSPALHRWFREPWSPEATWVVMRSLALMFTGGHQTVNRR